jgi:protein subunit release factor B
MVHICNPSTKRRRQKDHTPRASLDCTGRLSKKKKKKKKKKRARERKKKKSSDEIQQLLLPAPPPVMQNGAKLPEIRAGRKGWGCTR